MRSNQTRITREDFFGSAATDIRIANAYRRAWRYVKENNKASSLRFLRAMMRDYGVEAVQRAKSNAASMRAA